MRMYCFLQVGQLIRKDYRSCHSRCGRAPLHTAVAYVPPRPRPCTAMSAARSDTDKMAAVNKQQIGFIGGGMMAEAIAKGLLDAKMVEKEQICISEPFPPRKEYLEKEGWTLADDNLALVRKSDVVFLAVKPNVMQSVLSSLGSLLYSDEASKTLLISIAAGLTLSTLQSFIGARGFRLVRVMPNTPCLVGTGASGVSGDSSEDVAIAKELMGAVGIAVAVPEYQLDAVTCVSGSGPAYVYVFIETLADAGVMKGLPRDVARQLATQTVLGATQMVTTTGEHPAQLRNKVESPGGTTIAAVRALEKNGFRNAIYEAVEACYKRTKELS